LRDYTLNKLSSTQQLRCYFAVSIVILPVIEVLPLASPLQGILVDEPERNAPLIKVVRYIPPVVASCLDGEYDTSAIGFHHFYSGSVQHHFQTFPVIVEFEFAPSDEILSDSDCGMLLLVRVDSHHKVSLRNLVSFPGCGILHL
jgi:hypothetical protein